MKAYLKRESLKFETDVAEFRSLPEEIECEVDIGENVIHLRIFLEKRDQIIVEKVLKYLENPTVYCDIDTMMQALEVEDA